MVISRTSVDAPKVFGGIPATLPSGQIVGYQEGKITRSSVDLPVEIAAATGTKKIITRTGTEQAGLQEFTTP